MSNGAQGLPELTLGHLYPDQLNIYGDRGNIITLARRCAWRGIRLNVLPLHPGATFAPADVDLYFIGGGQDKEQTQIADDLVRSRGAALLQAVEDGAPLLAVCGGYQLLARSYRPADGSELKGLGIFDAETVHPGIQAVRCVGNIALSWRSSTLIGFENHGGRTYLGASAEPLGKVLKGFGNNGSDGHEGCIYRNAIGTYMHGSLLPRNPHLADHVLRLALNRKYGLDRADTIMIPLDDTLEWDAHRSMLRRLNVS